MQELSFSYLYISVDTATNLLYSQWLRVPQPDEYRTGMHQLAAFLELHPIRYWIQESTHLSTIPLEEQGKALREMAPAVLRSELKKLARVVSLNFAYMSLFDQVVTEEQAKAAAQLLLAGRTIEVQQFNTYKEAADWIADLKP